MTQQPQVSVVALISGTILLLGGLFGIYYQGPFWASGVVAAMNPDEDALALGLPAGVTLAGAFLLSYALLASPLTSCWSSQRRLVVYVTFAFSVLAACGIAAWLAGQVAGAKLQTTQGPSNKSAAPNAGIASGLTIEYHGPASVSRVVLRSLRREE